MSLYGREEDLHSMGVQVLSQKAQSIFRHMSLTKVGLWYQGHCLIQDLVLTDGSLANM